MVIWIQMVREILGVFSQTWGYEKGILPPAQ
jgi:hypothetical protein